MCLSRLVNNFLFMITIELDLEFKLSIVEKFVFFLFRKRTRTRDPKKRLFKSFSKNNLKYLSLN